MKTTIILLALITSNYLFSQNGKIEANNINATVNASNVMFQTMAPDTIPYFEALKGSGATTIFASSMWTAGFRNTDSVLCGSFQSYINSFITNEYSTGPLTCIPGSGNGGTIKNFGAASISPAQRTSWNKVFCVSKLEVETFVNWFLCQNDPMCDTSASFPGYVIPSSIQDWPAHGNVSLSQDFNLAPFVDINTDGFYNPTDGDHPCIKGDQYCWYVINDRGTVSKTNEMGIEVHVEVYSFNRDSSNPLSNTIFVGKDIINRSTNTYTDFVVGQNTDFDLGCASDDYIGSMGDLNSYYGYNGDETDDNCSGGAKAYGISPPAQGVTFLNKTMANSMYYSNSASTTIGSPINLAEANNYMNGKWQDGTPLNYGGNGYPLSGGGTSTSGVVTNHIYPYTAAPGNTPWTEITAGNVLGDRRMIGSAAPITFGPGNVYEIDIAYVFSRSTSGNIESVNKLYQDIQTVQAFYNDSISSTCEAFTLSLSEEKTISVKLFPNPANNYFTVQVSGNEMSMDILSIDGKMIASGLQLSQSAKIDATNWENGIYLIKIYDQKGNSTVKRIVKN